MACEIPYDRCGEYNKKCPDVGRETTMVYTIADSRVAAICHSHDDTKARATRRVVTV